MRAQASKALRCDRADTVSRPIWLSSLYRQCAGAWKKHLARNAGFGWIGKHTNLIDRNTGSYFLHRRDFFGSSSCPWMSRATAHCGSCNACIPRVSRRARSLRPYRLDARRCISYLTIELAGAIPPNNSAAPSAIASTVAMTASWFALGTNLPGLPQRRIFAVRHGLDHSQLVTDLFAWSEADFLGENRRQRNPPHRSTSVGCATWRWRWVTRPRRAPDLSSALTERLPSTPHRWCVNTSSGRSISTWLATP